MWIFFALFSLLIGYSAYAAQIIVPPISVEKKARLDGILDGIKDERNYPKVTLADINLFIKDDGGSSVKAFILASQEYKEKRVRIDFTSRSLGEKMTDKLLYLCPLSLMCITTDLVYSGIDNCSDKAMAVVLWTLLSGKCHEHFFSSIESFSSLERKMSKALPEGFFYTATKSWFRSIIYCILNIIHSTVSVFVVKHLWSPFLCIKVFVGALLATRTACILKFYNMFEEADSQYMPNMKLGDLVNCPKFANANKTDQ